MDHFFAIRNLANGWYYISSDRIWSEQIVLATQFITYESARIAINNMPRGFYEVIKVYY